MPSSEYEIFFDKLDMSYAPKNASLSLTVKNGIQKCELDKKFILEETSKQAIINQTYQFTPPNIRETHIQREPQQSQQYVEVLVNQWKGEKNIVIGALKVNLQECSKPWNQFDVPLENCIDKSAKISFRVHKCINRDEQVRQERQERQERKALAKSKSPFPYDEQKQQSILSQKEQDPIIIKSFAYKHHTELSPAKGKSVLASEEDAVNTTRETIRKSQKPIILSGTSKDSTTSSTTASKSSEKKFLFLTKREKGREGKSEMGSSFNTNSGLVNSTLITPRGNNQTSNSTLKQQAGSRAQTSVSPSPVVVVAAALDKQQQFEKSQLLTPRTTTPVPTPRPEMEHYQVVGEGKAARKKDPVKLVKPMKVQQDYEQEQVKFSKKQRVHQLQQQEQEEEAKQFINQNNGEENNNHVEEEDEEQEGYYSRSRDVNRGNGQYQKRDNFNSQPGTGSSLEEYKRQKLKEISDIEEMITQLRGENTSFDTSSEFNTSSRSSYRARALESAQEDHNNYHSGHTEYFQERLEMPNSTRKVKKLSEKSLPKYHTPELTEEYEEEEEEDHQNISYRYQMRNPPSWVGDTEEASQTYSKPPQRFTFHQEPEEPSLQSLKQLQDENNNLKANILQLQQQNQQLIEDLEGQRQQNLQESENSSTYNKILADQLNSLQQSSQQEITGLLSEKTRLIAQLENIHAIIQSQNIEEKQALINQLQNKNAALQQDVISLQDRLKAEFDHFNSDLDKMNKALSLSNEEKQLLLNSIELMKQQKIDFETQIQQMSEKHESRLAEAIESNDALNRLLEQQSIQLKAAQEFAATAAAAAAAAAATSTASTQRAQTSTPKNNDSVNMEYMISQMKSISDQNSMLSSQVRRQQNTIIEYQNHLGDQEQQLQSLKSQIEAKESKMLESRKECEILRSRIHELSLPPSERASQQPYPNGQNANISYTIEGEFNGMIQGSNNGLSSLQKQEYEDKIADLTNQVDEANLRLDSLQKYHELYEMESDKSEVLAQAVTKIRELEADIETLNANIVELQEELFRVQKRGEAALDQAVQEAITKVQAEKAEQHGIEAGQTQEEFRREKESLETQLRNMSEFIEKSGGIERLKRLGEENRQLRERVSEVQLAQQDQRSSQVNQLMGSITEKDINLEMSLKTSNKQIDSLKEEINRKIKEQEALENLSNMYCQKAKNLEAINQQLEFSLLQTKQDFCEVLNAAFDKGGNEVVDLLEMNVSFRENKPKKSEFV